MPFLGGYVSSLEGMFFQPWRKSGTSWYKNHILEDHLPNGWRDFQLKKVTFRKDSSDDDFLDQEGINLKLT